MLTFENLVFAMNWTIDFITKKQAVNPQDQCDCVLRAEIFSVTVDVNLHENLIRSYLGYSVKALTDL